MIQIPINGGSFEGRIAGNNSQSSINMYPAVDQNHAKNEVIMQHTPGVSLWKDTGYAGMNRGMHVFGDYLYVVIDDKLLAIASDATVTLCTGLDITTTSTLVQMVDNTIDMVIFDDSEFPRKVNKDTPTVIEAFATFSDRRSWGCAMAGSIYYIKSDSDIIYATLAYDLSDLSEARMARAESSEDIIVGMVTTTKYLWVLGEDSTEIWAPKVSDFFPAQRVPGGSFRIGCSAPGSITEINDKIYWLTDKREVVRTDGQKFETISTEALSYEIFQFGTYKDAVGWPYTLEGRTFYVLSFPDAGKCFCWDTTTRMWHEWNIGIE